MKVEVAREAIAKAEQAVELVKSNSQDADEGPYQSFVHILSQRKVVFNLMTDAQPK